MTDQAIYLASIYRLTAVNFWKSANILSASLNSDGTPATVTAIPFYFLVSHAAELLLKAALLKRGFPEGDLRKFHYRHDLNALMEELRKLGILITSDTVKVVHGLSSQHKDHALRYSALVDDGRKTYMPPPPSMLSMLEELLSLTRISTQGI